jgi:hypothetical protein
MDAQQPSRWRWAWFCPRCGVHNLAAAEACEGCGLDHALIGAPGATVLHSCGVAAPGWAAYCIGCGAALRSRAPDAIGDDEVAAADESADAALAPRDLDLPPLPPPRPRRILPASDGPAEGLTLTRHALLERAVERPGRADRLRLLLVAVIVVLSTGLVVRVLATSDDQTIASLRAHALPVRGSAEALSLLEVLHRLLAGQAAAQSPAWALRVERVEAAPNGSQGRWLVVRLALRNNGGAPAQLAPGDVRLVDPAGREQAASDASTAVARAAGVVPLGVPIAAGQEATTIAVFAVPNDLREARLRAGGAEVAVAIPAS